MELQPIHFIGQSIEVRFDKPPLLEKKPTCPDAFDLEGMTFRVVEILAEWADFERRGRYARNMRPAHAVVAEGRGSWGVGRFYFRVKVEGGRFFDLYYDREPQGADQRKGSWYLYRELSETNPD